MKKKRERLSHLHVTFPREKILLKAALFFLIMVRALNMRTTLGTKVKLRNSIVDYGHNIIQRSLEFISRIYLSFLTETLS